MTPPSLWADTQFWAIMVMPIGGALVGLFCWVFLFPKADKTDEPHKR